MKILYIAPASVNHTVRWVNAMSEKGHKVHLMSLREHREGVNEINKKVKIHYLNISGHKGYYLNWFKAKKIIKRINPDIINTHYASGYGTLSRFINSGPVLLSVWGSDVYDFPNENKLKKKILEKNLKSSFKVASTSNVMAEEVRKYIDKKIYVTPFGVDTDIFKPLEINKKKEIKIGIVKTLKPKYGVRYLIKAISILVDRLIKENKIEILGQITCDIYGDGEEKNELMNLTKQLNIESIVSFKGYIENKRVSVAINQMDIFCAPSILDSESFGVAAVEAMACEVPVVTSDVDGFREVVEDQVTGYIVPRKNSEALADKIYELIFDEKKRKIMGINGRKRVKKLYDWKNNVDHMEKVYKEVIEDWKNEK